MIFNDNIKVLWSVEFIQKFENQWDWIRLSSNPSLPWSINFIKKFEDKLDWESLSSNTDLPWSLELIKSFKYKWNWKSLSSNHTLPWSIELIGYFEYKWDWEILSSNKNLPWSKELITKFESNWNIERLCYNKSFPWSEEIIDTCISIWDWKSLSSCLNLPWSIGFIDKYKKKLDRNRISRNNGIKWTIELLNKYNWNWELLSENRGDFWSIELIKHFENKWNWLKLSSNQSLPWSKELIKQFGNKWKFNIFHNKKINWSNEFLDKYQNLPFDLKTKQNSPLELLEDFDNNWFKTESVFKDNSWSKTNLWSIEDDIICEKFIKWNSNIENVFQKLEKWLEIEKSENNNKLSAKIIKVNCDKNHINVQFEKWEVIFWKKISASNNINFEFISKFKNELDWEILIKNSALNWTLNEMSLFANHLSVEANLWSPLKPHLNSDIVNSLLQNVSNANPILNYNHYTPNYHTIFSVITFGRYKGKTLYEIIRIDSSYINWCIVNLNHFYFNDHTLNAIKIFYPYFELSTTAIKALEKKTIKIKLEESQIGRTYDYDNDYEKPQSFEDWLDTEFGDQAGTAYWNLD